MPRHRHFSALIVALALVVGGSSPAPTAEPAETPDPPVAGFRADYLVEIARLRDRTLALVGEIPPESLAQAAGGHSLTECLSELSAASRRILRGLDHELPPVAGGQKDAVVEDLTTTLDAVRQAVEATSDDGLGAPIDYLGRRWTTRALFLLLLGQMHEGLGHATADAESLGIVPPWVRQKAAAEASED